MLPVRHADHPGRAAGSVPRCWRPRRSTAPSPLQTHLNVIIPSIRGVLGFVILISIMDVLRVFDTLVALSPQAAAIGNESIMFYIYSVAFSDGGQQLGLGSAINVLTDHPDRASCSFPSSARRHEKGRPTMTMLGDTGRRSANGARPPATSRPGDDGSRAPQSWSGGFLIRHLSRADAQPVHLDGDVGHQADRRGLRQPAGLQLRSRRSTRSSTCGRPRTSTSYLINTLVVAVISTVLALVIGLPAAYALSRVPGWISTVLLVVALIFRALPRFAVVLPMYDIARRSASTTPRSPSRWPWSRSTSRSRSGCCATSSPRSRASWTRRR